MLVSATEIRQMLAGEGQAPLTEMAISQFVKDGMPKAARGQYDAVVCMAWRIGKLRQRATRQQEAGGTTLDDADIRLKTVKAEREELKLAEEEGRLIPLALHESLLSNFAGTVTAAFNNLPARLAGKLEGLTTLERKALLRASVRGCLASLAAHAKAPPPPMPADTSTPASTGGSTAPATVPAASGIKADDKSAANRKRAAAPAKRAGKPVPAARKAVPAKSAGKPRKGPAKRVSTVRSTKR